MDEAISMVSAITGTTPDVARHFLSLTDGDAEQAVQLFYDSPDLSSTMAQEPSPPRIQQLTSGGSSVNPPTIINLDSDDEDDRMEIESDHDENEPSAGNVAGNVAGNAAGNAALHTDDDEAVARRMQEELYAGGDVAGGYDEHGVRAPLARTTETLVGPGSEWATDDVNEAVLQQMRARAQQRPRQSRPGVFNQVGGPSSIWDESNPNAFRRSLADATGGESETSSKAARLAELFRPPFELMTRLPWDDVRQKGKDESKWIIVNVQDTSIFDCQSLNRDIWKHEGIKDTIQQNFIFLQYDKNDPRGNQYIQYYFPLRDSEAAYPHIAIIDPRTGERVKFWSGPPVPKAADFLMNLYDFLERYSLNVADKNPVAKRKPEKSASIDVDKLSEEQMLDLALQNSLANGGTSGPKEHDPDDLTKSIGDLGKGKAKQGEEEHSKAEVEDASGVSEEEAEEAARAAARVSAAKIIFDNISSTNPHVEPQQYQAPNVTRIQFRHSNGRVIRRFFATDPVRRIFEWLKAEPIGDIAGVRFQLKSLKGAPPVIGPDFIESTDLIERVDKTIKEAGVMNGTVMIELLED